jgi:lysozyme
MKHRTALDRVTPLVARFEGFVGHVYRDAVGVETIGYGETNRQIIEHYRHTGISKKAARHLLRKRLLVFIAQTRGLINVPVSEHQLAALTSFAYNLGSGALGSSTLLRELNQRHYARAANEFLKWDRAGGRVLAGLTRRRRAERRMFLRGSNLRTRLRAERLRRQS